MGPLELVGPFFAHAEQSIATPLQVWLQRSWTVCLVMLVGQHLHLDKTNAVITIAIRLRYDYDKTTMYRARLLPFDAIQHEQKMYVLIFRHSRIVVVSQSN